MYWVVYVLALLILITSSVLFGYVWCQRVEDTARADAAFWRRVAHDQAVKAWANHYESRWVSKDTGLCQTCGLEPGDPDCGCVCDCHHRCGRVEASRG